MKLGDEVLVLNRKVGIVRFNGVVEFSQGVWTGIELHEPLGRTDGSFNGRVYFSCSGNHGTFLRESYVVPYSLEAVSATAIQSVVRMMLSRRRVATLHASRTWNILDEHYEQLGLQRGKALGQATKELRSKTIMKHSNNSEDEIRLGVRSMEVLEPMHEEEDESDDSMSDDDSDIFSGTTIEELQQLSADAIKHLTEEHLLKIQPPSEYEGPHLQFPLTLETVVDMLEAFKSDHVLHLKYFMLILLHGKNLLDRADTVQDISIQSGIKLTVVGDTHGQLQDLFTIFQVNGLPSATNWYLFNGDFVDRGPRGCEILSTMLAFKILYPTCVFLNRGNHEARAQNAWMGFEEELLTKYGNDHISIKMKPSKQKRNQSKERCSKIHSLAKGTPDRYRLTMDEMNSFTNGDRLVSLKLYMLCQSMFDTLPLCAVIQERVFVCHGGLFRNDNVKLSDIRSVNRKREPPLEGKSLEDRIYEDILWSDPRPTSTYTRPLQFRRSSDRGAGCEFGPQVTNKFCAENSIALIVRSHECVSEGFEVLHNGRLITIFSASRYCGTQTNKGAFITFGPELQPEIQQFYAHAMEKGSFLTDAEREQRLVQDAVHMIIEQILDKRLDLYWYFTKNDKDHVGKVSKAQWNDALKNVLQLDIAYLHYQRKLVQVENDGMINYSKFLSRFQIQMRREDEGWQDAIVRRICEKLYSMVGADLEAAYRRFDANADGTIEYEEFMKTLKSLDIGLTDQQIFELMRSVDVDEDAHINFKEFAERFEVTFTNVQMARMESMTSPRANRPARSASMKELEAKTQAEMPNAPYSPRRASKMKLDWNSMDNWTLTNLKIIAKAIYTKTDRLVEAFNQFDVQRKGFIVFDDFFGALEIFCGMKVEREDAEKLFQVIDTNDSNRVNYLEFVDAFRADDNNPRAQSWKYGVVQQVANVLYQNRIHMKAAFRMFDIDGSGKISAAEFEQGMQTVNALLDNPLTNSQIEELRLALDHNRDGSVDYKEFFLGLSIADTANSKQLMRAGSSSYMDMNDPMFNGGSTMDVDP